MSVGSDWRAGYCRLLEGEGREEPEGAREWSWEAVGEQGSSRGSPCTQLSHGGTAVLFHPTYSSGTACVRGTVLLAAPHHHFWEMTVDSPVYGTDVMVGLTLQNADLTAGRRQFCSLLGQDADSWGWSYQGYIQHKGEKISYGLPWAQGDRLGVHLDTWRGTVEFYLNRKPLGLAFQGLRGKQLYPALSSTAAKSSLTLATASSLPNSLQFLSVRTLAHKLPGSTLLSLLLPPGIRNFIRNNYWFFLDHSPAPFPPSWMLYDLASPAPIGVRCKFVDDRLVAAIRSPAVPVDSQTDTEDENDCFLATPQTRREAKQALLAKCKGEQEKQEQKKRLLSDCPAAGKNSNCDADPSSGAEPLKEVLESPRMDESSAPVSNRKRFRLAAAKK